MKNIILLLFVSITMFVVGCNQKDGSPVPTGCFGAITFENQLGVDLTVSIFRFSEKQVFSKIPLILGSLGNRPVFEDKDRHTYGNHYCGYYQIKVWQGHDYSVEPLMVSQYTIEVGKHVMFELIGDLTHMELHAFIAPIDAENNYTGTDVDDVISGGHLNDVLSGLGGNDTINGLGGNDEINGGIGRDTLSGGAGDDTLTYDADDQIIDGGEGDDVLLVDGTIDFRVQHLLPTMTGLNRIRVNHPQAEVTLDFDMIERITDNGVLIVEGVKGNGSYNIARMDVSQATVTLGGAGRPIVITGEASSGEMMRVEFHHFESIGGPTS
jgi:hypothetical protein